ncbi:MAG: hypothetical protein COA79_02340 [Planctomycetota bacterium]|nr:MAG: hypothetical protein COA79_02340 [Planctomycetota bacterium]
MTTETVITKKDMEPILLSIVIFISSLFLYSYYIKVSFNPKKFSLNSAQWEIVDQKYLDLNQFKKKKAYTYQNKIPTKIINNNFSRPDWLSSNKTKSLDTNTDIIILNTKNIKSTTTIKNIRNIKEINITDTKTKITNLFKDGPAFLLQGTCFDTTMKFAVIKNKIYKVGHQINGWTIFSIESRRIKVSKNNNFFWVKIK